MAKEDIEKLHGLLAKTNRLALMSSVDLLPDIADDPRLKKIHQGKVRDSYFFNDGTIVMVATDRVSAFDSNFPNGVPDSGIILTQINLFWTRFFDGQIPHHLITDDLTKMPEPFRSESLLGGRTVQVHEAQRIDIECIARGYITGSALEIYQKTGRVIDIELPAGLREADQLQNPIYTPTTKAEVGHDLPMFYRDTEKYLQQLLQDPTKDRLMAALLKNRTLWMYQKAAKYAIKRGIIIADTKFEFGFIGDSLTVIDEILTPDSSRFWPAEEYQPGRRQNSFDKQILRDWVLSTSWNKEPPAPPIPKNIIDKLRTRYIEGFERLAT